MPQRPPGRAIVSAFAVALIAALTIAVLVEPGPLPGELAAVRWWQARRGPIPRLAELVRLTTSTEATLVVFAVPAAVAIARWRGPAALAVTVGVVTMLVVQPLFKLAIDRPRPSPLLVDVRAAHTSMSFPSGHSMSTTTAWGALVVLAVAAQRRGWAIVCVVPIVLTGFASQVQGVHWPSDALAGSLIGGIAAVCIARAISIARAPLVPAHHGPVVDGDADAGDRP